MSHNLPPPSNPGEPPVTGPPPVLPSSGAPGGGATDVAVSNPPPTSSPAPPGPSATKLGDFRYASSSETPAKPHVTEPRSRPEGVRKKRRLPQIEPHAGAEAKFGVGPRKPGAAPAWPAAAAPAAAHAAKPTALPKRPKGRLFVGSIILILAGLAGHRVWDSFLRFQAYGTVIGEVVEVGAAEDGVVRSLHVRVGDRVEQGQLLATVEDAKAEMRMLSLGDELRIADADLQSQIAKLHWDHGQLNSDRAHDAKRFEVEHYQLWGRVLQEQSKLMELKQKLDRVKNLSKSGAATGEDLESLELSTEGQRGLVRQLQTALDEMRKQIAADKNAPREDDAQLKPFFVRIESLQAEMVRLRERLRQNQIRSPVTGRVLTRQRFTGECVARAQTIFEVLEDDSLAVVLYLPQSHAEQLHVGDNVEVMIEPRRDRVGLVVERISDRFEAPPKNLQRYYKGFTHLLPVYLRPKYRCGEDSPLRLDCEVRLPQQLFRTPNVSAAESDSDSNKS